jgi:hypothetical protein
MGRKLVTLEDAIAWLAKEVPKSEHGMNQVQAAAHCVTEAAEYGGPMMLARMGMMPAIDRHRPEEFDPKRKSQHWGGRKLARDQCTEKVRSAVPKPGTVGTIDQL